MPNIGVITDLPLLEKMHYAGMCHMRRIVKDKKDQHYQNWDMLADIQVDVVAVKLRIEELQATNAYNAGKPTMSPKEFNDKFDKGSQK